MKDSSFKRQTEYSSYMLQNKFNGASICCLTLIFIMTLSALLSVETNVKLYCDEQGESLVNWLAVELILVVSFATLAIYDFVALSCLHKVCGVKFLELLAKLAGYSLLLMQFGWIVYGQLVIYGGEDYSELCEQGSGIGWLWGIALFINIVFYILSTCCLALIYI